MTDSRDSTLNVQTGELTSDTVADWLRLHPEFLETKPEVIAYLLPPQYQRGQTIVDMQKFLLDRLQREMTALRSREQQLLAAVDLNATGQARIHKAIISIVSASSIRAVCRVVRTKLPEMLDVTAAEICAEKGRASVPEGMNVLEAKSVAAYVGAKRRITLKENTRGDARIFGAVAEQVRSMAYIKLRPGSSAPVMMLALGSSEDDGFHSDQALDLLAFLADVMEVRLKLCLKKTS